MGSMVTTTVGNALRAFVTKTKPQITYNEKDNAYYPLCYGGDGNCRQ